MRIKLLLLQPRGVTRDFTRSKSVYPPLGLCQIAAMFNDSEVMVLDAEGLELSDGETKEIILSKNPIIFGLTTSSFTIDIIESWSVWAKKHKMKVIVGGPHASIMPLDLFNRLPFIDFIIRGEAEGIILKVVDDIINKRKPDYPGVCYKDGETVVISDVILVVDDLSKIPFPTIKDLPLHNYHCPDAKRLPMFTMQLSRGCPNNCAFCSCSYLQGKKIRYFDTNAILDRLEYMSKELGIKEISFVDDGFTTNKQRALEICNGIIHRGIDISWFCNARADCLSEDVVRVMKQAGCHQVYIGFESGSNHMLKSINKNLNTSQLVEGSRVLKKHGINLSAGFIVGLPGETLETLNASIKLARDVKPTRIQFSRFVSLPGSTLYEMVGQSNVSFHQKAKDEIDQWIEYAYSEFRKKAT